MPPTDVFTQRYEDTTTKHYGDLQNLTTANNVTDNRQVVAGPLGFGDAVQLDKSRQQCLTMTDTDTTKDPTYDPSSATAGFSVSLWVKAHYTQEVFLDARQYMNYPREYLASTGGDTEGHRGFSIYQQGIFLFGVVSTGTEHWQASVAGALPNDEWTSLGLRWAASIGVELVVNSGVKSYTKHSVSANVSSDPIVVETTIGCRRNPDPSAVTTYDGFTSVELDEYSIWDHYLKGNETIFFMGGYVGEPSYFTPDIFMRLLEDTNLNDPAQRAEAVKVLGAYLNVAEGPEDPEEEAETITEELAEENNSTTNNTAGVKATSTDNDLEKLVRIIILLSNSTVLPRAQTTEETSKSLDILTAGCKMLKSKRREDWKEFAEKEDGWTPMQFVGHLEQFILASALSHGRNPKYEPRISKTYECAIVQIDTMKVNVFMRSSQDMGTPTYYKDSPVLETWGDRINQVEVPRDMYTDQRCINRTVVSVSHHYRNLEKLQSRPLPIRAGVLNRKVENILDSHISSLRVGATQVLRLSGRVDPTTPPCQPDPLKLKIKPRFAHLTKTQPLRQLLFHANLTRTKLEGRRCVRFNPDIGEKGAWQGEQCRVWSIGDGNTKCMCRQQGFYAVLAQMVEKMVVPAEPEWLVILRYVLYGLSAACLLFFILVVAFAGDLKEQFHLMGLCLAACLLAGSVFMVVSDLQDIRTDRHTCAAIGTLLHACYLGAGAWMAMIGHASFKCITSGIVGGRMKQYGYLAAGLTLVSVGCTYAFFLNDLGNDPRCFISWYDTPKEVFFAPQVVFCCVALFCALVIVFNLKTASYNKKPSMDDYRSFSRGAALLIVYFCLTWSLAVVAYLRLGLEIDFYPVFQILNGLSGVMLLLCLGVCSSRFRMVLTGHAKLRREGLRRYMGRAGDGGQRNVLVPPSVAPSPRLSGQPRTATPVALSAVASRPSSSTLEVPSVRPRSTASLQ